MCFLLSVSKKIKNKMIEIASRLEIRILFECRYFYALILKFSVSDSMKNLYYFYFKFSFPVHLFTTVD